MISQPKLQIKPHTCHISSLFSIHSGYEKIVELLLDNGASYVGESSTEGSTENNTEGTIQMNAQNGKNYIYYSDTLIRYNQRIRMQTASPS